MKKRFSMLLALTMLLTSLIPSFTANAAFSDVDASHPYQEAISTLSTLKVINGYEDGTFAPDKETAIKIFENADAHGTKCFSSSALRFVTELKEIDTDKIFKIKNTYCKLE